MIDPISPKVNDIYGFIPTALLEERLRINAKDLEENNILQNSTEEDMRQYILKAEILVTDKMGIDNIRHSNIFFR